jgi:hypothetical protein
MIFSALPSNARNLLLAESRENRGFFVAQKLQTIPAPAK